MTELEAIRSRNEARRAREQWPEGEPTETEPFKPCIMHESQTAADIDYLLGQLALFQKVGERLYIKREES